MKKFLLIPVIIISICSCGSKKTTDSNTDSLSSAAPVDTSVSFFPVTEFIKGQLVLLDSITTTPLRIITNHQKIDSQSIKREQLRPLLQTFITPEINKTNLIKYFKESKFNDQTINAITFSYDPIASLPDSIALSTWNVYVDPTSGNIIKVYIVKHLTENGQKIIQQLTWQTGQFATITEIVNKPDGSIEIVKQEKIIWNFDN